MTYELLKEDLIQTMTSRPTRVEAEVLAGRIVDLIYDAAKEVTEDIVVDHIRTFEHSLKGT